MRVLIVAPRIYPSFGGIETHVMKLANELAARGHKLTILAPDHIGSLPATETHESFSIVRAPMLYRATHLGIAPRIRSLTRELRSSHDVLHIHGYHATAAPLACSAWDGPTVFSPHYHGQGHSFFRSALHTPYRFVGGALFAACHQVIAVTEAEADLITEHFPSVSGRVSTVSNGVELNEIRCAKPLDVGRYGLAPGSKIVLAAGRIEGYKSLDRLIASVPHLNESFSLVIAGDGPALPRLRDQAEQLGLTKRVKFLGRIELDELHSWRATATVFASLSAHEAQSIVLLEALARGIPVVASDIPAHRDVSGHARAMVSLVGADAPDTEIASKIEKASTSVAWEVDVPTWADAASQTEEVYERATEIAQLADQTAKPPRLGSEPHSAETTTATVRATAGGGIREAS